MNDTSSNKKIVFESIVQKYILGPSQARTIALFIDHQVITPAMVSNMLHISIVTARVILYKLKKKGLIRQVSRGKYVLDPSFFFSV